MGTSLSGSKISDKFQFLIKTAESAISSSLTNIEDGAGNASDLSISNNKVKVGTALGINQSSPTFKLDINGTGSAVRVDNGTNASLLVGKGSTFGFCAGDCNPATTVGGGSAGSTAAQANKNYIAIDPTFQSNAGRVTIMNGASSGTGAIGIGADSTANGFIEFGSSDKVFKFTGKTATQAFYVSGNSETQLSIDSTNKRIGLGEDTSDPQHTVEIRETGSAKANTDILAITNKTNAADMDGTRGSLLFNQYYYDASTPAAVRAGRISVGTETDFTSTSSTHDTYLTLETCENGTLSEKVRVNSLGYVGIGITNPTSHLHVSGNITATGSITSLSGEDSLDRYKLEDYFEKIPRLAASVDGTYDTELSRGASTNFMSSGSGHVSNQIGYDATKGLVKAVTKGDLSSNTIVIEPHDDTYNSIAISPWKAIEFRTDTETSWECLVQTDNVITDYSIHAGLKLTSTKVIATDTDQAYFFFDTSSGILSNAGTPTTWHFAYSNGGTDYVTNLGLVVEASTNYHLKIDIDENRKPAVFINGSQLGLSIISGVGDTGVNVNGAVSLVGGQSHVITVDGTDATTQILVGDVLQNSSGTVLGTVTAVSSATSVTITASSTQSLADDTDIHINGRAAASSTTIGAQLHSSAPLIPFMSLQKHTNATQRSFRFGYQKISRKITT